MGGVRPGAQRRRQVRVEDLRRDRLWDARVSAQADGDEAALRACDGRAVRVAVVRVRQDY